MKYGLMHDKNVKSLKESFFFFFCGNLSLELIGSKS